MRSLLILASCLGGLLLSACGSHDAEPGVRPDGTTTSADALPAPERARGGVTGMPDTPGPGEIGAPGQESFAETGTAYDDEGNPLPPEVETHEPGDEFAIDEGPAATAPDPAPADAAHEPGAQQAAAVVSEYYDAINRGSLATAYRLWSNDGRASGQSPQQFADGFAQTAQVAVEIMQPGRIDAATGARYIEVPVAVATTRHDGSIRRYVGAYTLRRSVVDGASAEQRAWRITSADIREVRP